MQPPLTTSPLPATASPDDTHGSSPRDTSAAGSVTGRVERTAPVYKSISRASLERVPGAPPAEAARYYNEHRARPIFDGAGLIVAWGGAGCVEVTR
jgi:hypothetical protein